MAGDLPKTAIPGVFSKKAVKKYFHRSPCEISVSLSSPSERALQVSLLWAKEKHQTPVAIPISDKGPRSDEILLVSLRESDQDALAELFRRHSRLVFSIGFAMLSSRVKM